METFTLENVNCVNFTARRINRYALLIEKGYITAKIADPRRLPKGIPRFDLKKKYVIPGFTDCHTHLVATGIEMQRLDLSTCRSLDDCLQRISAQAKKRKLVFASNWDENSWRFDDSTRLNRRTLDRISRSKPIIMRRICGHYAVVNTCALQRIPRNWKIVDRRNGLLYEDVALNLNDIFMPTDEMLTKAVRLGTNKALQLGITSVHEISIPRRFRILQKLRHKLRVRFAVYLPEKHHKSVIETGLRTGYGDDWLKFAGTKIYVDGSLGARTAALWHSFTNSRRRGNILVSKNALSKLLQSAENNGIQLMIHSIGDRATSTVLDVLRKHTQSGNPLRHRIEHLEILAAESVADIAGLKIIASMQPNFVHRWQNPEGMYHRILGNRYLRMNCFKSLLNAHVKVVFGSDCMPLGPIYGVKGAVGHPSECGRLHIADALRLYTEAGPYATFDEKKKGRIESGHFADLVILNKNPLEEQNLNSLRVEAVMVNGRFAYRHK